MIMSTTIRMPAAERIRSSGSALVDTVKKWWLAYLTWRIERLAIVRLEAMSDRELEDIGLTRSQIESAVTGERSSSAQPRFEPIVYRQPHPGRGDAMVQLPRAA